MAFQIEVRHDPAGPRVTLTPGSSGVVTVDGRLLEGRATLRPGQIVGLGPDAFVFEVPGATGADTFSELPSGVGQQAPPAAVPVDDGPPLPGGYQLPLALLLLLVALLVVAFGDLGHWPILVPTALLVVVAAVHQRRVEARHRSERRAADEQRLERFRAELDRVVEEEGRQRRRAAVGPHHVLAASRSGRRIPAGAPVALALGTASWRPRLADHDQLTAPLLEAAAEQRMLPAVPVAFEPTCTLLGIVGPGPARRAVARHVVSATLQRGGPTALSAHLGPDRAARWPSLPLVAGGPETLVLVDGAVPRRRPPAGVVLADTADELPFVPDLLMSMHRSGAVSVRAPGTDVHSGELMPIGMTAADFDEVMRRLRSGAAIDREAAREGAGVAGVLQVTVGSGAVERGTLATIVFDVLRDHPRTRLVVLDRADRGLAELTGLSRCAAYHVVGTNGQTSTEQVSMEQGLLGSIEALADRNPLLVVARGVPVEPMSTLIDQARAGRLLLVATDELGGPVPAAHLGARVCDDRGELVVLTGGSRRPIARRRLSRRDLGVAVAAYERAGRRARSLS